LSAWIVAAACDVGATTGMQDWCGYRGQMPVRVAWGQGFAARLPWHKARHAIGSTLPSRQGRHALGTARGHATVVCAIHYR